MIINYIVYSLISSLTAFISLLMSNKILFAIIVFICNLLLLVLCDLFLIKKAKQERIKSNDLTNFIHDFYLGYIKNYNLKEAINFATLNTTYKVVEQLKVLEEYSEYEKLEKLSLYFNDSFYSLFIKSINKDKKELSIGFKHLINENNKEILRRKEINDYLFKSVIEYAVLWIVAFLLVVVIRLLLSNQFKTINSSAFYLIGVAVFFIIFAFSNYCFILSYTRSKK